MTIFEQTPEAQVWARLCVWRDALTKFNADCREARQWGGPTINPTNPVTEATAFTFARDLRDFLNATAPAPRLDDAPDQGSTRMVESGDSPMTAPNPKTVREAVERATLYTKDNEESPYTRFEEMAADLTVILSALAAKDAALFEARVAAYDADATTVHEWWSTGNVESKPDFTEAAHDYAYSAMGDQTNG